VFISRSFPHSRLITGLVTRLTRRVPLVEMELLTLSEHLSSPSVFSGVPVARSLVLYVCFVDHFCSFVIFSFGHCVVCSSSIYGFSLHLCHLQTLLIFQILGLMFASDIRFVWCFNFTVVVIYPLHLHVQCYLF
jgi:hypothetical protein